LILATLATMAQQPRPVLEVTDITGGIGVSAYVTNVGDENASDVNMTIAITGGVLGLINFSETASTALLQPQESISSKATLFRLGQISITVTADASNADQVTRHATGLLLGPFVMRVSIAP
jgi:hypothetical protein